MRPARQAPWPGRNERTRWRFPGRCNWPAPLVAVLLALLLVLSPASLVAAESGVVFRQLGATVAFPEAIEFTLDARAEREVTRLELLYAPAFSPVTTVVRPPFQPGRELRVSYRRDMLTNYLPPGLDIHYRWRLHFADGSWVDSPEQTLLYLDQRYSWVRTEQGPVQVFSAVADPSHGQTALRVTLEAIDRFHNAFGLEVEGPIRVVVYGSQRDLLSALPPQSAEWIGGIAQPELRLILTGVSPGPGAETEFRRVLSHEVVHLLVAQATSNPYNSPPAWLDEGLAAYYQEVEDARFGPILERAVRSGSLIPVRALNSSFPVDPEQALLSYAESRSVVQFIVEQLGEQRMAALLRVFQEGVSYDEAVQRALGMTIDELDQAWKAWLGYPGDRVAGSLDGPPANPPASLNPSLLLMAFAASLVLVSMAWRWVRARRPRGCQPDDRTGSKRPPDSWLNPRSAAGETEARG